MVGKHVIIDRNLPNFSCQACLLFGNGMAALSREQIQRYRAYVIVIA